MKLNYPVIIKILGVILAVSGIAMIPSVFVALFYGETSCALAFGWCCAVSALAGLVISKRIYAEKTGLNLREGYIIVAMCWTAISLVGAIPYMASGYAASFIDAFFESVAGFTTTGCTVSHVELMPRSVMMWKAMSHWLGGMGILVFAISIMPALGISGQKIIRAEAPGPTVDKLSSRMSDSAKILYLTYFCFTVAEFLLLLLSEMTPFEALINSMGNISTAGLFTHTSGLRYFDSVYIESVMSIFSVLSTTSFMLYAYIWQGKLRDFFKDAELRVYLCILFFSGLAVSLALYYTHTYDSLGLSMRYGFFQTISTASTSGYSIDNYTFWPPFCICVLFLLMFVGGCTSSTSGALKVMRIIILFKLIRRGFYKRLHPRVVVPVRMSGKPVSANTVSLVLSFILLYFSVYIVGTLLLSLQDLDILTTMSASAAALSNTGNFFNMVMHSAAADFSIFSAPLRFVLSILMILGRLEIVTVIILFMSTFRKR